MNQKLPHFGNEDSSPITQQIFFLYSWGKNKNGELSIGNQKFISQPKGVRGLQNTQISSLSSGSQHSALVTKEGRLLVCGSSLHGKLGLEDQNQPNYPKFQMTAEIPNAFVKQVSCGDYHTMCLLDNGEVYAWGGTLHKKLGQRAGRPAVIQALINKFIVKIDCGDFHSAALTQTGVLYTWGGGGRDYNKGQLGHGHLNDVELPEIVKFGLDINVTKISCGGYHMMALDDSNQLWSWGQGMYGETGQGEYQDISLPKKVQIIFNQKSVIIEDLYIQGKDQKMFIIDIQLGGHHSIVLTNNGIVYTCGYTQYGQLGVKSKENQNKFQLVQGLLGKEIVQIAAGWNHSVVLTSKKDIYTCGHNAAGQLGVGDEESRTIFTQVVTLAGKNISKIFAGGSHTWALIDYESPTITHYIAESPIKEEQQLIFQKEQQISEKSSGRQVEIIVGEVDMCHRFVGIKTLQSQEANLQAKMSEYTAQIQKDRAIKLIKIQSDQQATGISQSNEVSYTIMIVSEMKNLEEDVPMQMGPKTSIGQKYFVVISNQKSLRWQWVTFGEKMFSNFQVKYFELRPQFNEVL